MKTSTKRTIKVVITVPVVFVCLSIAGLGYILHDVADKALDRIHRWIYDY